MTCSLIVILLCARVRDNFLTFYSYTTFFSCHIETHGLAVSRSNYTMSLRWGRYCVSVIRPDRRHVGPWTITAWQLSQLVRFQRLTSGSNNVKKQWNPKQRYTHWLVFGRAAWEKRHIRERPCMFPHLCEAFSFSTASPGNISSIIPLSVWHVCKCAAICIFTIQVTFTHTCHSYRQGKFEVQNLA